MEKPLLARVLGHKTQKTPIWFLRQAGRYLPEYQDIRKNKGFVELCRDPILASQITLQPLRRFDLDGAIIFSDILMLPWALGQDLTFEKDHGPILTPTIRELSQIQAIGDRDPMPALACVGEAIQMTKSQIAPSQTMIGFCGAPFTVASYMIEGSGSKNYTQVKTLAFRDPEAFRLLLLTLAEKSLAYLLMQKEAGADLVMVFDSWAGALSSEDYRDLVLPSLEFLWMGLKKAGLPAIYYPGQGSHLLGSLGSLPLDALALDWRVSIQEAHGLVPRSFAFQGNLDPQALLGKPEFIETKVRTILNQARDTGRSHIFNVGHGLLPHTDIKALEKAIQTVRGEDQ